MSGWIGLAVLIGWCTTHLGNSVDSKSEATEMVDVRSAAERGQRARSEIPVAKAAQEVDSTARALVTLHIAVIAWFDSCVELKKKKKWCRRELKRQFDDLCREATEGNDCRFAFDGYCRMDGAYGSACGDR
jgi:hypothetical protein